MHLWHDQIPCHWTSLHTLHCSNLGPSRNLNLNFPYQLRNISLVIKVRLIFLFLLLTPFLWDVSLMKMFLALVSLVKFNFIWPVSEISWIRCFCSRGCIMSTMSRTASHRGYHGRSSEPWTRLSHRERKPQWFAYNPRTMRPPPLSSDTNSMKILSYNVNGLQTVVESGFSADQLFGRENFDVLCLQETHLKASLGASNLFIYTASFCFLMGCGLLQCEHKISSWPYSGLIWRCTCPCCDQVFILFSGGQCWPF
jgi:hypothetical protein